jgi:hypothetical protein
MTLSIKKLHLLLNQKGLLVTRHYVLHHNYFIVEAISVKNGEGMLVWIPSKYKIPSDKELKPGYPHYKVKLVEFNRDNNIVDKYGNKIDNEKYYPDIDIDTSKLEGSNDIEKLLKENYEQPLTLESGGDENIEKIKPLYHQLDRLKHCVKYISYGLTIMSGRYFCITNERNEIESYMIKNCEDNTPNKKLYVILSLENLIVSDHSFEEDVKSIHEGIKKILDKNKNIHSAKFLQFMNRKNEVVEGLERLESFNSKGREMVRRYEEVLNAVTKKESELIEKSEISKKGGITNDLLKTKLEDEIKEISEKKDKIREKILELQDYISDVTLKIDQILFDNIVLLKTIHSNVDKLQKIFLE